MSRVLTTTKRPSLFGLPRSWLGRASLRLLAVFCLAFGVWLIWIQVPRDRGDLAADPFGAALLIAAAACGSLAGLTGIASLLSRRERSLLLAATSVIGMTVFFITLGRLVGR